MRIVVNKSAGSTITRTDLFVFTAAGQQECHLCFTDSSDTHRAALTQGEKQIVAIVNSPYILNGQSTSKIESLEQLVFQFKDDSPGHPAMSGSTTCVISPGTASVEVPVTQLMCSVVLTDISNNLTHYRLLENPRISLTAINPEAEIMRVNGFRPSGMARDGEAVALPCDVGFYTQYPGTVLHCYPDETPENTLGRERTGLLFECEIQDTTRQFTVPLPPLPRGCICPVGITIDETEENTYICTYVCSSQNMERSSPPVRQYAAQGALCQCKFPCLAYRRRIPLQKGRSLLQSRTLLP